MLAMKRPKRTVIKGGCPFPTDQESGLCPVTQANREAPVFQEMRALVSKTIGIFSVLRSALQGLSKRIVAAFVYGSLAREEETAQSDIDLLVVGDATLDEVLSRLSAAEKTIGRPINPTVYSIAEFRSKVAAGNHFLHSVLKGRKVFLLGNEDELGKVGRIRLAKARSGQPR
jgi:predicted nucleotidyltransferase